MTRWLLVILGAACMGFAVALVAVFPGPGQSTTTTDAPAVTTSSSSSSTPMSSTSTAATQTSTISVKGVAYARTIVTAKPGSPQRGSDAFDVALLGIGVVLVLSGAFWNRLAEIDFPGGGGIKLNPSAAATLRKTAADKAGSDKRKQRELISKALIELDKNYWGYPADPGDDEIKRVVEKVAAP
jgi:hypothetical protein